MKNHQFILFFLMLTGSALVMYGEQPDSILFFTSEEEDRLSCEAVTAADFIFEGVARESSYTYQAPDLADQSSKKRMIKYFSTIIEVNHVYKGNMPNNNVHLIVNQVLATSSHSTNAGGTNRPYIYFVNKNKYPIDKQAPKDALFVNFYPAPDSGIAIDDRIAERPSGLHGIIFNDLVEVRRWLEQCGGKDQIKLRPLPEGVQDLPPNWTKQIIETWGELPSQRKTKAVAPKKKELANRKEKHTKKKAVTIATNFASLPAMRAGAGEILTINGSGFGTVKGKVYFKNAQDVTRTLFTLGLDDIYIQSWTDTKIEVEVPSFILDGHTFLNHATAGSGPIIVESGVNPSDKATSSTELKIESAYLNIAEVDPSTSTLKQAFRPYYVKQDCSNGLVFTLHNTFIGNTDAINAIEAACSAWQTALNNDFELSVEKDASGNVVFVNNPADPNRNVIAFANLTGNMETTRSYTKDNNKYYRAISNTHIYVKNTTGHFHFKHTGSLPAFKYDFYRDMLHELGHVVGLEHIIDNFSGPSLNVNNAFNLMSKPSVNFNYQLPASDRVHLNSNVANTKHTDACKQIATESKNIPFDQWFTVQPLQHNDIRAVFKDCQLSSTGANATYDILAVVVPSTGYAHFSTQDNYLDHTCAGIIRINRTSNLTLQLNLNRNATNFDYQVFIDTDRNGLFCDDEQTNEVITAEQEAFLEEKRKKVAYYISGWNEQEVQTKFIAPITELVNFDNPDYFFAAFSERKIEAVYQGIVLKGNVDWMVAIGKNEPRLPFFFIHEYKKQKGFDNDPKGQLLATMLTVYMLNLLSANWT